jgi:hypothetical protein
MKIWSSERSYKDNKNFACENDAEYAVSRWLRQGSESEQLVLLQELLAILADKMLDTGNLKLEDFWFLDGEYYATKEEVPLDYE